MSIRADIPLQQFMPFNPVWVAGAGDILNVPDYDLYMHETALYGSDDFGVPGQVLVGVVQHVTLSPGVDRWMIDGLDETFLTKAEAMMFLQSLEFKREEEDMRQHYGEYMRIYHTVLREVLDGQAVSYEPAIG